MQLLFILNGKFTKGDIMATPQELIDKVVFGGLYEVKSGTWERSPNGWIVNDQCYGWAVPIMDDNGNLWMQDTYQLPHPTHLNGKSKTDAAIEDVCNFGPGYNGWVVKKAIGDYCYKNQMKIESEDDLNHFKFIADLHDYRGLDIGEYYRDYQSEDLIHGVQLYFEHGYDWEYGPVGVTLIRKNAKKNSICTLNRVIDNAYSEFRWPRGCSNLSIHKIDEAVKACTEDGTLTDELSMKVSAVKILNGKLNDMLEEFESFYKLINE